MKPSETRVADKYKATEGRVLISGTQALVRLPLMQKRIDQDAGLNTAGFISGYRGSPLGAYDTELWRAQTLLAEHNIVFQPGVNEDLAATAIWGTQQLGLFPGAKYDGVFSLWYGKGPGVDRSGDAFKHANLAGTASKGGVIVAFGDDHGAKSSTLAHQSEQSLIAAMIPILNPATIEDILDFGIFGWAMSRYAGVWVGLKCVNELVESSASIELPSQQPHFTTPANMPMPPGGIHIRMGHEPIETERRLHRHKLPMVQAFARTNHIDKYIWNGPKKRLGIVTTGKAYLDVRQALTRLGIDEQRGQSLGIGIYKVGLTWPIEPDGMKAFASGYQELLFVEEKRPLIEDQAARLLYGTNAGRLPVIVGKTSEHGEMLLPSDGMLDPGQIAHVIGARLKSLGAIDDALQARLDHNKHLLRPLTVSDFGVSRRPYFCAGCPHNSSTKVPAGSHAMAGIGCSYMAVWMDRETVTSVHMGAEGANWNGIAPFTATPHVFQNIGDGTYYHSGLMAIRAAVSSGVNITYKILFNDAVAMTGGQPFDGPLTVPQISRQVSAEGVHKVAVVTDEPNKYPPDSGFAPGVTIHHRDELQTVQEDLRNTKGATILIYDQTCAAEKRRRRKRHEYPDPPKRVFINDAVCEGCGDCTVKSNCVSVLPLETEFGRKRQIDQSACNKDYSCVNGFCPSFVTVHGGQLRKPKKTHDIEDLLREIPDPDQEPSKPSYAIIIAGIGGTGVVTIGTILGMAAHLEGKGTSIFDMTGLAQKNGAVISHIRITDDPRDLHAARVGSGEADLLLGCDLIVSATSDALQTVQRDQTRAIINSNLVPTGDFQQNTDIDFHETGFTNILNNTFGDTNIDFVDATRLALTLAGDSIATNLFMVGYACQKGLLPLSPASIVNAIEANNIAVESNKRNFSLGRLAAYRPEVMPSKPNTAQLPDAHVPPKDRLQKTIERHAAFLTEYQNASYTKQYTAFVAKVKTKETEKTGHASDLTEVVAKSLFKLMAYKDEYEVARLYTNGQFIRKLNEQFEGKHKLRYHLSPPLFAPIDPVSGEPKKLEFGPWVFVAFRMLAALKQLRGTVFDIFGYTHERKIEKQLVTTYKNTVLNLLDNLTAENLALATQIADLPQMIRGYGHVKLKNLARVQAEERALLARFGKVSKQ